MTEWFNAYGESLKNIAKMNEYWYNIYWKPWLNWQTIQWKQSVPSPSAFIAGNIRDVSVSDGRNSPTDWTISLPKAFFLDWTDRTKWEHNLYDPTIWLPLGIFPQELREGIVNNYYIRISKTQGDIIGIGVAGSNSILGKFGISNGASLPGDPEITIYEFCCPKDGCTQEYLTKDKNIQPKPKCNLHQIDMVLK